MRTVAVCLVLAAVVALAAAEAKLPPVIETIFRSEARDDFGQYSISYTTANGIAVEEHGELKPTPDGKDYVLIRSGSYSFVGDDGKTYTTTYHADENGFDAKGDHLPKAVAPVA